MLLYKTILKIATIILRGYHKHEVKYNVYGKIKIDEFISIAENSLRMKAIKVDKNIYRYTPFDGISLDNRTKRKKKNTVIIITNHGENIHNNIEGEYKYILTPIADSSGRVEYGCIADHNDYIKYTFLSYMPFIWSLGYFTEMNIFNEFGFFTSLLPPITILFFCNIYLYFKIKERVEIMKTTIQYRFFMYIMIKHSENKEHMDLSRYFHNENELPY